MAKADNKVTNDQTGSSLIPGLDLGAALMVIGVLVLVGFIFYTIFGAKGDDKKGGGGIQPTTLPPQRGKFQPSGNMLSIRPDNMSRMFQRHPQMLQEASQTIEANPELLAV